MLAALGKHVFTTNSAKLFPRNQGWPGQLVAGSLCSTQRQEAAPCACPATTVDFVLVGTTLKPLKIKKVRKGVVLARVAGVECLHSPNGQSTSPAPMHPKQAFIIFEHVRPYLNRKHVVSTNNANSFPGTVSFSEFLCEPRHDRKIEK
ncbi:hypothetical protein A6X21_12465 [Planctopirus hydrillae]|uniref:Uncharacterized protein n=1 Tax=Planctopirus hydrillae TaxID=1841610 RepID=A0A1C3E5I6_9PLAN|nr:hypothetical protein A6X21_12465 [Planctopirus hydrillae]